MTSQMESWKNKQSISVNIYFVIFPWAFDMSIYIEQVTKIMSGYTSSLSTVSKFNFITLYELDEILNVAQSQEGILVFPYQRPGDVTFLQSGDYTKSYDRILKAIGTPDFQSRCQVIGICGVPVYDILTKPLLGEPFLTRDWSEPSISLWIQKPRNAWDLILAIEFVLFRGKSNQ